MNPPTVIPTLRLGTDQRLEVSTDKGFVSVSVSRCFPWTSPDRYYSLRDGEGVEVAFVPDPSQLDAASREALDAVLALPGFAFQITAFREIKTDFELRVWKVDTRQGAREFQTELDTWPDPLPGGGWVLRDVTRDLYRIPPLDQLDPASRKLFASYVE
jgi:hypothetical protein